MSVSRLFKSCFAAALLLFAAVAGGALPPPERLREQLNAATPEKYPNADTVTLYDCERVTYQTNGLHESTNEFCIKALTEAGRKELRKLSFEFDSAYGSYSVPRAEIVKPDGRRIVIDLEKHLSVAISTRSMGSNIYSADDKVLTLTLPDLEVGDALLMTLNYKSVKTPFPGIFSDHFGLQSSDPILFAEVIVDAPEALPLRSVAVKSPAGDTVKYHGETRAGGRIVYRWTAENVPQLIPEPDMPPLRGVAQRLLVSTAKDWKEISIWYYNLCRPRLDAVDDALKAEVARLVSGKNTEAEKAMALFQFVSQKIRYTGVDGEDRAPGFEPHDVKDTFRQRHGVCRDKAGLLVAMLELAGLKAYPVLFYAAKSTVDDEVPASRFNHAIVAWETAPGKYQLMDPTCESTQEFLPAYLANQSYLVARPDGEVLRRSPSPPAEDNALDIVTVAGFDRYGALKGESTFEFKGYNDLMYRGTLARRGADYIRQIFARQLQRAIPGAEITSFTVSPEDVRDMSKPLKIVVAYSAPDSLPVSGTAAQLPVPEIARYFGLVSMMTGDISLGARKYPLRFDCTSVTKEKIALKLPDSVRLLELPAKVKRTAPGAEWTREFGADGGIVRCVSVFKIDRLEIAPEQYGELRELRRGQTADVAALPMARTSYSSIPPELLTRIFPDADSFLESDLISVEVKSDNSYRIVRLRRRRILTYAGVKNHSELKVVYNPLYQKLEIGAVVTTPDGRKHQLDPKHIIDMDVAWAAAAPRYPKACTKVAVLPSVQIGAVVETRTVLESQATGFFDLVLPLLNDTPTALREVELTVTGTGVGKLRLSPPPADAEFTTRRRGGVSISVWRQTDLPAIPREFNQPAFRMFAPTVFVSNGKYSDYAALLNRTLGKLAETPSPAVDRLFAELKFSDESKEEMAVRIRDAVARRLRAAGPALFAMRLEDLTPPERTLADGYGNSADRAVVIAALLKRAKLEYTFVAASDLPYLQENAKMLRDYPQQIFDEVLVYIPELNMYLNDTDQYAVPGSTPHASLIGLALKTGRLTAIRPRFKAEDESRTTFDIRLASDGSASVNVTLEYRGTLFNRRNREYSEMTPEERRQYSEIMAAGILPMGKLEKAAFDFSRYPGRIELRFRVDDFARKVGDRMMFELPGYSAMANSVGAVDVGRRTPALRNSSIRTVLKYRIEVPAEFTLEQRRPARVELGRRSSGYFTENTSFLQNRIAIDSRLVLPAELIQPCDYVELVDLQRDLVRPSARRIVLVKGNSGR